MASAQVVEASVNTNNSPSQDCAINPDDHSNHNIDLPGFKLSLLYIYFISKIKIYSQYVGKISASAVVKPGYCLRGLLEQYKASTLNAHVCRFLYKISILSRKYLR